MASRRVFQIQGLPVFREPTQITIDVPAFAGTSFAVVMDFPDTILASTEEIQSLSQVSAGIMPVQTMQTVQMPLPSTGQNTGFALSSSRPASTTNPLGAFSSEMQAVSAQRPLSPGRKTLENSTIQQPFLPSISNPSAPQGLQPVPLSRSSLTTGPVKVLSPRGSSPMISTQPASLAPVSLGIAPVFAQTQQMQMDGQTTFQPNQSGFMAQQPITGQDLASQFVSIPSAVSVTGTPMALPMPAQSLPKSPPVAPQLSKRSSVSNLSDLLTSPKMLSPRRFQGQARQTSFPKEEMNDEGSASGSDNEDSASGNDEAHEMGGMLPRMSVYRCAPAEDLGEPKCELVFPRISVGDQLQSRAAAVQMMPSQLLGMPPQ